MVQDVYRFDSGVVLYYQHITRSAITGATSKMNTLTVTRTKKTQPSRLKRNLDLAFYIFIKYFVQLNFEKKRHNPTKITKSK